LNHFITSGKIVKNIIFILSFIFTITGKGKNFKMGIKINAIQVATGSKIVGNDVYLNHFKSQDKDVKYLMEEIMGRKNRYMLAEGETMLGLVLNSVKGVLKRLI